LDDRKRGDEYNERDGRVYHRVAEVPVAFGGDAILNNLRTSSEFHQVAAARAEQQAEVIRSIGVEIAERILASNAALNAKQEVRITLRENVLQGTEVVVAKDGKMLSVNFFTSAAESAALLASRQAELRLHLLNNLPDVNDVDVNIYQEQGAGETGSGDSRDGRSRDEYVGDYDVEDNE
jgi:hypothetical protein